MVPWSKYDTFVFSQYLGPNMIRLVVHGTLVEVWYFHFFTVPWSKAPRKGNKWVEGMVVLWVPDCDYILHEILWKIYVCLDNNAIDYISMINIIKWMWSSEFLIQRDGRKEAARGTWRELVSQFDKLSFLSSSIQNWYCLSLCQGNVKEADNKMILYHFYSFCVGHVKCMYIKFESLGFFLKQGHLRDMWRCARM